MSEAAKRRRIEVRIGTKRTKLFLVPKEKVRGIENLLAEYEVEGKQLVSAKEVFAELDRKFSEVGNVLAGFRLRDNLTQSALAKALGTSQPVIAAIENGKRKVGKKFAYKLGKVFKTDFRIFLG